MTTKSKTSVKLKPIVQRKEEKKNVNLTTKKIPPVGSTNEQQSKTIVTNTLEYKRLIHGDFTQDFSKQTSRLFRIFLSSTFSDFKVERNELYRRVFPLIKQRCAQLGYEFQVVDMRWGVSDTADSDHTADIICMDEIERCIDLSAGLNFIYLIGNRYGYMYVPLEIVEDEFESIVDLAREEKIENIDLIEKWFQLDRNSFPQKYVYVPITTHFKHFEEQSDEQHEEKARWQNEEKLLLKALRASVDKAFEKKKLSEQQAVKYFQSITEREIRRATIESNRSNVIGIIRDFSNPSIETAIDAKFFDSSKNERITTSINQLKTYCVKVTPAKQFQKFTVPWKSGGLNIKDNPHHREYIDGLCHFLTSTILPLVETTCHKISNKTLSPFREDLLHHALFCREKRNFSSVEKNFS